ncbi:MAG TPA: sigma-70 family RNA polymerase sigma factor [Verrucomicrobiae bacterium]|nr:sigma-70 family RNA polymerase sigma factor [Verrucomicrobiae bacterium]
MPANSISRFDGMVASSPTDNGFADRSEEQLVAEAKGGSHVAFEKLVESYRTRIFRIAHKVARSYEDAEDVIQQSFHKAFVHLQSFEGRSSFSTWLTRIALNEALMLRRSNRRLRQVSIDDASATSDVASTWEIIDSRPNPEHSYSEQERQRLLLSAINELKPAMRTTLQICDIDERSVVDTAQILGLSVSAVKSRVRRGRKELRKKLKSSYGTARGGQGRSSPRNREFRPAVSPSHSGMRGTVSAALRFRRSLVAPSEAKASAVPSSDCFASAPRA